MENDMSFEGVMEAVRSAEKAIVQAQGNDNPQDFQRAHLHIMQAQQLINDFQQNDMVRDEHQRMDLHHAQELLKHLLNAQDAIQ
ncbi:hypothetical protein HNQ94_002977 [Salirhabdus euzebyi]|uniref:DUF2564 family protein n=1 Tax=Salirhabdus euzebyi TaxID=394506 RepID=A0A841Q7Z1_9BACI|nr:hypothetical protein [Salirhabdus euzebyi]MBB6454495.1 hypothetical protein [Salirhabdus euzebyi]